MPWRSGCPSGVRGALYVFVAVFVVWAVGTAATAMTTIAATATRKRTRGRLLICNLQLLLSIGGRWLARDVENESAAEIAEVRFPSPGQLLLAEMAVHELLDELHTFEL